MYAAIAVEAAANAARAANITVICVGITNGKDYNATQVWKQCCVLHVAMCTLNTSDDGDK